MPKVFAAFRPIVPYISRHPFKCHFSCLLSMLVERCQKFIVSAILLASPSLSSIAIVSCGSTRPQISMSQSFKLRYHRGLHSFLRQYLIRESRDVLIYSPSFRDHSHSDQSKFPIRGLINLTNLTCRDCPKLLSRKWHRVAALHTRGFFRGRNWHLEPIYRSVKSRPFRSLPLEDRTTYRVPIVQVDVLAGLEIEKSDERQGAEAMPGVESPATTPIRRALGRQSLPTPWLLG